MSELVRAIQKIIDERVAKLIQLRRQIRYSEEHIDEFRVRHDRPTQS